MSRALARARGAGRAAALVARLEGRRLLRCLAGGGRGAVLQVEPTNRCNFRCSYCVTHSPESRLPVLGGTARRGDMSLETFRAILAAHPEALLVVLQGDGEPFLDRTLFEKIALARQAGALTQVITNGSLLSKRMIDRLVDAGPDVLLVSLDAVSPERNMAERHGLDQPRVLSDLRALIARNADAARPMLIGMLSIVHGAFDAQAERAVRDYDALGIDVLFYKQLNAAFEGRIAGYRAPAAGPIPPAVRRTLRALLHHQRIATTRPCPQLRFDLPYYLFDGRRTPCCVLNDARYAAPEFERAALLARHRARSLPAECERCSYFGGYG